MNDKESKIVEKILLILKKKKNKNSSLTSKSTKKHLRSRKLVLNHLEIYRSAQEINSQPNFLRLFDFPIPKRRGATNIYLYILIQGSVKDKILTLFRNKLILS